MLKRLAKCVKGYWKNAILSPVFVSIEVAMDILIPLVMTYLLEYGVKAGNNKMILLYGGILALMSLVGLLFGVLSGLQSARAGAGFAANVRREMYYNVQDFSFSNVDKFSPSSIVTRMTTDVTFVQNSFQMLIRIAVRCPLMLIFALTASIIMGGTVALVYVFVVPVMLCGLLLIFKKAHPMFKRLFKKYDKLNRVVEENIRGMRVVKSNVREEYENKKFNESTDDIFKEFSKAQRLLSLNSPIMQLSMYIVITCIAWFASNIIISTGSTALGTEDLTSLITYSTQVLMSLMMLSMVYVTLTISKASGERICEILNEKSDIVSPENAIEKVLDGSISFENVCFSYDKNAEKYCLKNVNLKINSGETVGVIGGTGSSKTTLVQLIPRLYDASEGVVKVGGKNVKDYSLFALRKAVSMVLQKNVLFSGTIRENLLWGNENATEAEINEALKLSCADEFVNNFDNGVDSRIEQGGSNVSGGQKQRLCIARALLSKPKVLILDDSTSAVDMNTDRQIRAAFKQMIPDTTKLIIAQRVASVMDADKIIVLSGGTIDSIGTHEELIKSCEIYKEVYNSQIGGAGGDFDENNE